MRLLRLHERELRRLQEYLLSLHAEGLGDSMAAVQTRGEIRVRQREMAAEVQQAERRVGIAEVAGSSPAGSSR